MDTSEQYIKMRLEAIPYLGLGTSILSGMFVVTEDVFVDNKGDFYIHCDRAPYWCQLERQDQLQEMVGQWTIVELFGLFCVWFRSKVDKMVTSTGCTNPFITGEQLWLAFVMKEKFNKTWDGEKWV